MGVGGQSRRRGAARGSDPCPRLGPERVRQAVELLHASLSYTPDEMLEAARDGGFNPYRATFNTVSVRMGGRDLQVPWEGDVRWEDDPRPAALPSTAD